MTREFGVRRRISFRTCALLAPIDASIVHTALDEAGVAQLYPGFDCWFFGKVVPESRRGERRIITSLVAGALAGIAICKRTETERKLCTLWVSMRARGSGIATELADDAFAWLGTTTPLFTVPEERLADFSGLLRSWSFQGPVACAELYRPKRVEYVFNSRIESMSH